MNYLMHGDFQMSYKLQDRVRKYFEKIKTIEILLTLKGKEYRVLIDIESFGWLSNFDCFNCLTNCCVQFPYEFNEKARKVLLENFREYDDLTKAVSILKFEGMTENEIIESIKKDRMLIPEEHIEKTFDRCTCSCVHIDRHLCALHKICIDKGMKFEEILDTKPLWCSLYPLELIEDEGTLYIFVPTNKNEYLSINDSKFPCMDIKMASSPHFRRENPIGFKEDEYQPFILSYYSILRYIFGDDMINKIMENLNLEEKKDNPLQYNKRSENENY